VGWPHRAAGTRPPRADTARPRTKGHQGHGHDDATPRSRSPTRVVSEGDLKVIPGSAPRGAKKRGTRNRGTYKRRTSGARRSVVFPRPPTTRSKEPVVAKQKVGGEQPRGRWAGPRKGGENTDDQLNTGRGEPGQYRSRSLNTVYRRGDESMCASTKRTGTTSGTWVGTEFTTCKFFEAQ